MRAPLPLLLKLTPGDLDDDGMYVWAGILTAFVLCASLAIAIWWQRRKAGRQEREG